MHVGKFYPTHFRRDLMIPLEFPMLLPKRWVYFNDTDMDIVHDPLRNRWGAVSDVGVELPAGNGIEWLWHYTKSDGQPALMKLHYEITQPFNNHCPSYFTYETPSTGSFAKVTFDAMVLFGAFGGFVYCNPNWTAATIVSNIFNEIHLVHPPLFGFSLNSKAW